MELATTVEAVRAVVEAWQGAGQRVAFVPTMGNLHAGHLALIDHARRVADRVVVSIFVNPAQFGPNEDYLDYPRTLEADRAALKARGTDLLFAPGVEEIYPDGLGQAVLLPAPPVAGELCGASRPGHFTGVLTVVARLFDIVRPDVAVFGWKDYQQLILVRHMVNELGLGIATEGVDTVREADGLAMSSRNVYLGRDERVRAPAIRAELLDTARRLREGVRDLAALEEEGMRALRDAGLLPDYYSIRHAEDLERPRGDERALVILVAARLGRARLIDNLRVELNHE